MCTESAKKIDELVECVSLEQKHFRETTADSIRKSLQGEYEEKLSGLCDGLITEFEKISLELQSVSESLRKNSERVMLESNR